MSIVKVAKVLDTTIDFSSLPVDDCWVLTKNENENSGIKLAYRDGGNNIRILSPFEEFEKWYSFDNTTDTELSQPETRVILPGYSTIVTINSAVRASDLIIELPKVNVSDLNKNIFYTYRIRFAIDSNTQGFTIKVNDEDTGLILGKARTLVVRKSFTSFDMYLAPDNKWRILGNYEISNDAIDILQLTA